MAVVGEAHIIVRAITTQVKDDIKKGFSGVDGVVSDAGKQIQKTFKNDFAREAEGARRAWQRLQKSGFLLQTAIGSIAAAGSSLVASLGSLVGAVGGAAASIASLSGVVVALPLALITAKTALGGVGQAVQQATKAGGGYGKTLREINEELQQLKFDQEEAAISVERAGINLERARENLLRVQDLPIASRARREAELDAKEADLALRRAIDRRKDLAEELKKAQSGGGGGGGGTDPYAGLLPSQKEFAQFLVSIQGELKKLKAASADGFLPILEQQISRLMTSQNGVDSFFGTIERGLTVISGSLGQSVTKFFDSVTSAGNIGKLSQVFDNAGTSIGKFGDILGSVYTSFLTITTASNATTQRFLDFLSSKAEAFAEFLDVKRATGELETFFERSADLMGELGAIFGNVFGFIGDLIADNFSPSGVSGGSYLLSWIKQATTSWKNLRETVGESEFNAFLTSAAVNTRAILSAFTPLLKALGKLGADRNVKKTFDALAGGGDALGQIIASGAEAGPLLGELAANVTKIIAALSDSGAIKVFFSTLNDFAKVIVDLLENEVIKGFVNTIGKIIAFGLALQTVKTLGLFVFKVLAGSVLGFQGLLVRTGIMSVATANTMRTAFSTALGPIGLIVGAITAVVAGYEALQNEQRRTQVEALGTQDALIRVASATNLDGVDLLKESFKDLNVELASTKTDAVKQLRGDFDRVSYTLQEALNDTEKFKLVLGSLNDKEVEDYVNVWVGSTESFYAVREGLENIGTALGTVAQSNLPLATKKFQEMAKAQDLNEQQTKDLYLSLGDDFKTAIMDAGKAAGIYIDEQDAMNIAMGTGEISAEDLANAVSKVENAATEAKAEVDRLKEAIFNFGDVQLDANAANREFEAAIDDLQDALRKNGKTLDRTTDAGRANEAALESLAKTGREAAMANFELNGSSTELEAALLKVREQTIENAKAFNLSEEEATNFADSILGTDFDIKLKVKELTAAEARDAALKAKEAMDNAIENNVPYVPLALTDSGNWSGGKWKGELPSWLRSGGRKDGGLIKRFAMGGEVYGPGGPRSDMIPAMLSNGEFVVNAASTEKYLPLLRALNAEGIGGARMANGGMASPTINMTVNAAPGMDTSELVNEVSRRIAFELRSGVGR